MEGPTDSYTHIRPTYTGEMSARREAVRARGWLRPMVSLAVVIVVAVTLSGCTSPSGWFPARTPATSMKASPPCPMSVGKARDVSNRITSRTGLLAVRAEPTRGMICVYGGALNPATPVRQIVLNAAQASRLAMIVRKVSLQPPPIGAVNCPADTGSFAIIALAFNGSPDEDLWWTTSGCQTLDNGIVGAAETANNSFSDFQTTASDLIG
jgi:hypothetical protein